jgi:hypothetical protein
MDIDELGEQFARHEDRDERRFADLNASLYQVAAGLKTTSDKMVAFEKIMGRILWAVLAAVGTGLANLVLSHLKLTFGG